MFPKLLLTVLAAAVVAVLLLVNRQHRIETAHRLAEIHHRLELRQRALWDLRHRISVETHPERIRQWLQVDPEPWAAITDPPVPATDVPIPDGVETASPEELGG
ncbi:MAG: hypothetical protein HKO59_09800 [Phycisphaerales bacterium]|nr:hypothetical protein [Phycisphaerae bacterium]NNM26257.1 hypothetical protein [Phycisphaerales bacterium]